LHNERAAAFEEGHGDEELMDREPAAELRRNA
jgi:hypothetical protein